MSLKQQIIRLSGLKNSDVPGSWQIIGDVMLAKFTVKSSAKKKKIANAILATLTNVKTVCEIKQIGGELREPRVKIIAGKGTVTVHRENDILYRLDVSKVMFSKGNLFERKRLLSQIREGEIVIDMFAGIGYFTLPIAKFTGASVISIEKNPNAYNFLTENIELNKLNNVIAMQGDCRIAARGFGSRADHVLMGYFPGTEQFLPAAFFMAKPGATIHYHNVYFEKELWKKPIAQIKEVAAAMKRSVEIISKKKVKSVGPRKYHVVVDFKAV